MTPAKPKDSRSKPWRGGTCQLEALAPNEIAELLSAAIEAEVDTEKMARDQAQQEADRQELARLLMPPNDNITSSRKRSAL